MNFDRVQKHFDEDAELKAIDLGCGTGVLSNLILEAYPKAKVIAFDMAGNMLEVCKTKLSRYSNRLSVMKGNFAKDNFGDGYDIAISGLATHHLNDQEKYNLYKRIFQALNSGGIFLNREVVLGATPTITDHYISLWRQFMRSNGEDDEAWLKKYQSEDIPATVEQQIAWLNEIGFVDAGCHWRYFNYAIFGGRKL